MKKLMIAVAAVACAACLQAASFNWGGECLSSSGNVDYEGYANAGTVYTIYALSGLVDSSKITAYDPTSAELTIDGATATLLQSYTLTEEDWDNGLFSGGTIEGKDAAALSGYYVVAMYDNTADAGLFSAEVFLAQDVTDTQPGSLDIQSSVGGSGLGANLHPEVVPEPTSGLLLLLGVAGMALRRRRA